MRREHLCHGDAEINKERYGRNGVEMGKASTNQRRGDAFQNEPTEPFLP